ncbi:restriction endonuclease [Lasius niger]|uniref:Restriction endonuclease n=1 Tax=Lasius niger TaxID=67767 RepID=A0A0J7K0U0_LASNI|nr:restriction endonuclease [Lasius niger]
MVGSAAPPTPLGGVPHYFPGKGPGQAPLRIDAAYRGPKGAFEGLVHLTPLGFAEGLLFRGLWRIGGRLRLSVAENFYGGFGFLRGRDSLFLVAGRFRAGAASVCLQAGDLR